MAPYDQDAHMGRTYVFVYKKQVVGYIVLAMAQLSKAKQGDLGIDTYGDIPALLISHLATHKKYERRGIGRNMVSWAIRYAKTVSKRIGCRVVLVKAEKDVTEFYEKSGFVYATTKTENENAEYSSAESTDSPTDKPVRTDDETVMYFDIKEH